MGRMQLVLLLCIPLSLTSFSAHSTALGELSEMMQPGSWAVLEGTGFTGETLKSDGIGSITTFANKGGWDPISRKLLYLGQPHGETPVFLVYDDKTNSWIHEDYNGIDISHGYDLNNTDFVRGHHYYRSHRSGERDRFHVYDVMNATWSTTPRVPSELGEPGKFIGADYFREIDSIVLAGPGTTHLFHIPSQTWSKLPGQEMGITNNFVVYNPVHKLVIFGGGKENNNLYKLDVNKKITKLKNAPFSSFRYGDKDGDFLLAADPVSGDYIAIGSDGRQYSYDVVTDTWKTISDSAPVVSGKTIVVPISTYGVLMYFGYTGSGTKSKVYLYKHAQCSNCPTVDQDFLSPAAPTGLTSDGN